MRAEHGPQRVLALTWIAIEDAMFCPDCDGCFEVGVRACPKCANAAVVPLATFLTARSTLPPRDSAAALTGDHTRVFYEDVLHHAGNGLTPARVYAQHIAEDIELRGRIGPHFDERLEQRIARDAWRIVEAVDATITRLRALARPHPTDTKEPSDAAREDR